MKFSDLKFEPRFGVEFGSFGGPDEQALVCFPNGYGASVIRGQGTYGGEQGLYELAVLKGNKQGADLCYSTPITDDVIGHLTPRMVLSLLKKIEALPGVEGVAAEPN